MYRAVALWVASRRVGRRSDLGVMPSMLSCGCLVSSWAVVPWEHCAVCYVLCSSKAHKEGTLVAVACSTRRDSNPPAPSPIHLPCLNEEAACTIRPSTRIHSDILCPASCSPCGSTCVWSGRVGRPAHASVAGKVTAPTANSTGVLLTHYGGSLYGSPHAGFISLCFIGFRLRRPEDHPGVPRVAFCDSPHFHTT